MSEPFIGEIKMFGGNFAPRGYALCDGQLLAISQNTALFSILGTTYGGDGRTTFGLPDLRGRSPVHEGSGPGLPGVTLGEKGGSALVTLTEANLPSHTHTATLRASGDAADTAAPGNNALSLANIYSIDDPATGDDDPSIALQPNSVEVSGGGSGVSIPVRSPYQVVNFIIALVGLYPSRS
jgi:microcystin-dependent protein